MKRVVEVEATKAVVGRRRYTPEFRRLVVKEALAPGASVSALALKHRINSNMLFTWRRRYLRELAGAPSVNLLPVRLETSESAARQGACSSAAVGCIEIEVFGACIRLKGGVDAEGLCSVLEILSRR